METNAEEQRRQFVRSYQSGVWSMTELCERYGITRPTGYKWVDRWETEGDAGLVERDRRPGHCPHRTSATVEALLLAARREYRWGATKLLEVLRERHPEHRWPTRSTVNALLDRQGLLRKQRRRRASTAHPGAGVLQTTGPNQVWPADFKGQFKTRDGIYCYPLTVTDHFSRAILLCRGLPSTRSADARAAFLQLFREVGLPEAIRTDNGVPFASTGLHGLAPLNVWWMQLGIVHQRIRPGRPQANGTHERMHRELKRETLPAAATARAQQRRFDRFRRRYNEERPHEALGNRRPASLWGPSNRPYPTRVLPPVYPAHCEVRRVRSRGEIKFRGRMPFLSEVLAGEYIGLEEVGDGAWDIVYYQTVLGRFDERTGTISAG
jgi:transposase InsO family protein